MLINFIFEECVMAIHFEGNSYCYNVIISGRYDFNIQWIAKHLINKIPKYQGKKAFSLHPLTTYSRQC